MLFNLCVQNFYFAYVVIMPKYGKTAKIFGILSVMAKTPYGYWNGHPCLVGVVDPNVARVSIIEAEKCRRIDITCEVMNYHAHIFTV